MTLFDPQPPESLVGPTQRVRLDVAYDGAPYHGFAENPGVATVAGVLRAALERVLGHAVRLSCAGRTDRGVHASGQVVSLEARLDRVSVDELADAVTRLCGPSVVVKSASVVADDFDARFSARHRMYRYSILNSPVPDPLTAPTTWHVPQPLSLVAMRNATYPLIGEHDFTSFCRVPRLKDPQAEPSMVREVLDAHWTDLGGGRLQFEIRATSFCHQMVRSVVGMLVEVGRGRRSAGEMLGVLAARDRSVAGPVAPPHGLVLIEVGY